MSDWDAPNVTSSPQGLIRQAQTDAGFTRVKAVKAATTFVRTFQREGVFAYREALIQNFNNGRHYLEIDLEDLNTISSELHDHVLRLPNEFIPAIELGLQEALTGLVNVNSLGGLEVPYIQVLFTGELAPTPIRSVTAQDVNKLLLVPGIVISASRTRPKATSIAIRCKNCGDEKTLRNGSGFGTTSLPRNCKNLTQEGEEGQPPPQHVDKCPVDPFIILPDKCMYMDQQDLKLQEAPEMVPTGELPRHMKLCVERSLADKVSPGTRVSAIGVVSTMEAGGGRRRNNDTGGAPAVRVPYLRVVGIMVHEDSGGRALIDFTPEQEASLRAMAQTPGLYQRLASSIAPSISGDYTDDIKKAILCLLLAGSRKMLPDGMKLRGDINVLMLGDPSTAKSQFLKFVEKVAPVGVYTSGKGSSAAGLTASVVKDSNNQFYLEGGAMVLADGGVVCIDEFDKMREEDRVAIHEAMEQQTISIAKAGITTILNSRSAVLAAANPVYGRYDDTKSAADNIDLLPTILSRFDLIFIVRDIRNEARDSEIARHVMKVHINAAADGGAAEAAASGDIDLPTLKRYITYARAKCAPRLTPDAAKALQAAYVDVRQAAKKREGRMHELAMATSEDHGVIPVTVRQLEAMVRITEAVAKSTLSTDATPEHVAEALRLFRVSTLNAAASGIIEGGAAAGHAESVKAIEARVCRLLRVNDTTSLARLTQQLGQGSGAGGFTELQITAALHAMETRGELSFQNERKSIRRVK